jgi:RNA polymerase sigma-70 factor (ECF subfamily)
MLSEDVSIHSDGGGQRRAASRPVWGMEHVLKYHRGLARNYDGGRSQLIRLCFVNGLPGFVSLEGDGELQTTALEILQSKIKAVYVVRNPEKLHHLH